MSGLETDLAVAGFLTRGCDDEMPRKRGPHFVRRGSGSPRKKITVSISQRASTQAFEELKSSTTARDDSEVFRNALRLHLTLLRAHSSGARLFLRPPGSQQYVPVELFANDR